MARYKTVVITKHNDQDNEIKQVITMSTYAGKIVKGIAKCAPGDNFDESIGRDLSKARCDVKIGEKRVQNAERKLKAALAKLDEVEALVSDMEDYLSESMEELNDYKETLKRLEDSLG